MFNTLAAAVTNASMFDTPVPLGCLILSLIAAFIVACLIGFRIDTKHGNAIAVLEVERDNASENAQVRLTTLQNVRARHTRAQGFLDISRRRITALESQHDRIIRDNARQARRITDYRQELRTFQTQLGEVDNSLNKARAHNAELEKRLLGVAAFAEGAIDVSEEHFDDYLQSLRVTDEEHEQEAAQGVSFYPETATGVTHAWKSRFLKSYP